MMETLIEIVIIMLLLLFSLTVGYLYFKNYYHPITLNKTTKISKTIENENTL